jgi:murein DD-endopeptidase MepM/ murein hydrolase activator NlpD
MLIPQTDKRPLSFQLPTFVPKLALLLFLGVVAVAFALGYTTRELQGRIQTLTTLEQVNAEQRREIEKMTENARLTDELLARLRVLEEEILDLLSQDARAAEGELPIAVAASSRINSLSGRGGAAPFDPTENLPVLSNLVPAETRELLFGRRRGLLLASRGEADRPRQVGGSLEQAEAVNQLLKAQIGEANIRIQNLAEGKSAILNHLDYLAHRPTGLPVVGKVTDGFGQRWSPFGWGRQPHYGVDVAADYWTPIVVTGNGTVVQAGWKSGGYGYTVVVDHGYGFQTLYAHMIDYEVKVGTPVKRGQVIGYVGSSGLSTGPHLHYEVHVNGIEVDPLKFAR